MNLPPRYVQLPPSEQQLEKREAVRKVTIDEDANKTFVVSRSEKEEAWYRRNDYARFREDYQNVTTSPRRPSRAVISVVSTSASKEDCKVIRKGGPPPNHASLVGKGDLQAQLTLVAPSRGSILLKTILLHQYRCRVRGYLDPVGLSLISRALSKEDRREAHQVATKQAKEIRQWRYQEKEQDIAASTSHQSLVSLFIDYYLETVHPYATSPLSFLLKLCQCEFD